MRCGVVCGKTKRCTNATPNISLTPRLNQPQLARLLGGCELLTDLVDAANALKKRFRCVGGRHSKGKSGAIIARVSTRDSHWRPTWTHTATFARQFACTIKPPPPRWYRWYNPLSQSRTPRPPSLHPNPANCPLPTLRPKHLPHPHTRSTLTPPSPQILLAATDHFPHPITTRDEFLPGLEGKDEMKIVFKAESFEVSGVGGVEHLARVGSGRAPLF